jgi:hypothetical protein
MPLRLESECCVPCPVFAAVSFFVKQLHTDPVLRGTSGVNGVVSSSNSLKGSQANVNVGKYGVTALSNGNYVVCSPYWDNAGVANAGAVTWVNGSSEVSGVVASSNSLIGTQTGDTVGLRDALGCKVTPLSNGN